VAVLQIFELCVHQSVIGEESGSSGQQQSPAGNKRGGKAAAVRSIGWYSGQKKQQRVYRGGRTKAGVINAGVSCIKRKLSSCPGRPASTLPAGYVFVQATCILPKPTRILPRRLRCQAKCRRGSHRL
jgi:hypothetical protein